MSFLVMSAILLWAVYSDLTEYKIPNRLIVFGWVYGVLFQVYQSGVAGILQWGIWMAIPILISAPVFHIRGIGAGDIKLISVLSGLYGLVFAWRVCVVFFVLAGVYSLYRLYQKKALFGRMYSFLFFLQYGRKEDERYYQAERDGREYVVPMTPFFAVAYYVVLLAGM